MCAGSGDCDKDDDCAKGLHAERERYRDRERGSQTPPQSGALSFFICDSMPRCTYSSMHLFGFGNVELD